MDKRSLALLIDSTLLKDDLSVMELDDLCLNAVQNHFKSVCVYPADVDFVYERINDTPVLCCTAVGFPDGNIPVIDKVQLSEKAILSGADEIDMIMQLESFFDKRYKVVLNEIKDVVKVSGNTDKCRNNPERAIVKVIIETAALREAESFYHLEEGSLIRAATEITAEAGADFVKTSSGMHSAGGVKENDITLIKSIVKDDLRIKASGGIKAWDFVSKLIDEGANRIGTSKAIEILTDFQNTANDQPDPLM